MVAPGASRLLALRPLPRPIIVTVLLYLFCRSRLAPGQAVVPPPPPHVKPLIGHSYSNDLDANRIDDALEAKTRRAAAALQELRQQTPPARRRHNWMLWWTSS